MFEPGNLEGVPPASDGEIVIFIRFGTHEANGTPDHSISNWPLKLILGVSAQIAEDAGNQLFQSVTPAKIPQCPSRCGWSGEISETGSAVPFRRTRGTAQSLPGRTNRGSASFRLEPSPVRS